MTPVSMLTMSPRTQSMRTALVLLQAVPPRRTPTDPAPLTSGRQSPSTAESAMINPPGYAAPVQWADGAWTRSARIAVDDLPPDHARQVAALGVSHVVRLTPPALSEDEFQALALANLDAQYATDAGYLAARAAGTLRIERLSALSAELPGFRDDWASYDAYRGPERIGGVGFGTASPDADRFVSAQNAAGTYVMLGAVTGHGVMARWPVG
jgi:hypothetical protein